MPGKCVVILSTSYDMDVLSCTVNDSVDFCIYLLSGEWDYLEYTDDIALFGKSVKVAEIIQTCLQMEAFVKGM